MIGFIKKDLLMVKSNFKILIVAFVIYSLMALNGGMDMSFIFPFMTLMIFISTFSYDDFNNWHAYAVTLPNGRKNVVKSKYLTTLVLTLIASVLGLVLSFVVASMKGSISYETILSSLAGSLGMMVIMVSILYPCFFKYGTEKGRIVMIISFAIIFAAAAICKQFISVNMVKGLVDLLEHYWIILLIPVPILILYISYKISEKIYLKREF